MIDKTGNSVIVKSKDGTLYKRNSSFVKKFEERDDTFSDGETDGNLDLSETKVDSPNKEVKSNLGDVQSNSCDVRSPRPIRNVQKPVRFRDYVLDDQ